jgi:hypothetical protein
LMVMIESSRSLGLKNVKLRSAECSGKRAVLRLPI